MSVAGSCLLTFVAAATIEGVCAKWVEAVAHRRAGLSAALSMVFATAMLLGIDSALGYGPPAVTWVLGYGFGSYVVVRYFKKEQHG